MIDSLEWSHILITFPMTRDYYRFTEMPPDTFATGACIVFYFFSSLGIIYFNRWVFTKGEYVGLL